MKPKHKPCPFCGESKKFNIESAVDPSGCPFQKWIECNACGAYGPCVNGDPAADDAAWARWDKRKGEPDVNSK